MNQKASTTRNPKHWQLPRVVLNEDKVTTAANKTFYALFNSYGWTHDIDNANGGYGHEEWTNNGTDFSIKLNPFFLNATELVDLVHGTLRNHGMSGALWNGTAKNVVNAQGQLCGVYYLAFGSDGYSRYFGTARSDYNRMNPTPLRCLTQ